MPTNSLYDGSSQKKGDSLSLNCFVMLLDIHLADTRQQFMAAGIEVKAFVDDVQANLPQLTPSAVAVMPPLWEQLRGIRVPLMS